MNRCCNNRPVPRVFFFVVVANLLLGWSSPSVADSDRPRVIAIVVDDMGHHLKRGERLIDLPYPLTLSFLPGRKFTKSLAENAYLAGKEIMLHAPMETTHKYALGYGALDTSMDKPAIQATLQDSLKSVPYIKGMNNHMGSALTQNNAAMVWIMEALSQHPYYFLDSKTSANSVAAGVAIRYGIPTMVRDIFLDHEQSETYIEVQFKKLIELANAKGSAIAIAHPHQVTIDFLEKNLAKLGELGISMSTLSAIWHVRNPQKAMFAKPAPSHESDLALSALHSEDSTLSSN